MEKVLEREELVDIDGFQLYTKIFGINKGTPTIVMDAGYGDYSKAWNEIVSQIV